MNKLITKKFLQYLIQLYKLIFFNPNKLLFKFKNTIFYQATSSGFGGF